MHEWRGGPEWNQHQEEDMEIMRRSQYSFIHVKVEELL